jgi:hypothetical protein
MTFSRAILGTDKTKMNWWDYWVGHCFMTGWTSMYYNFHTWMDLVWFSDNQKHYPILKDDDPFEQCYQTFWYDLGADDTYSKKFLEYLMVLANEAMEDKDKWIPLPETFFDDNEKVLNDD